MKKADSLKAIVLSLMLAAMPSALTWGGPSGTPEGALFGTGSASTAEGNKGVFNRANVEASFGNETFGGVTLNGMTHDNFQVTPLGSGLAILVAAGAGYATVKSRKRNKK